MIYYFVLSSILFRPIRIRDSPSSRALALLLILLVSALTIRVSGEHNNSSRPSITSVTILSFTRFDIGIFFYPTIFTLTPNRYFLSLDYHVPLVVITSPHPSEKTHTIWRQIIRFSMIMIYYYNIDLYTTAL